MSIRENFWTSFPLAELNNDEWEALCDGCGRCCLIKLENEDTGDVYHTTLSCKLLDHATCRCSNYARRHDFVPDCIKLSLNNIEKNAYWLPSTCAYLRLMRGQALPEWHPLLTGNQEAMKKAGVSMAHRTTSEIMIESDDDAIEYIDDSLSI